MMPLFHFWVWQLTSSLMQCRRLRIDPWVGKIPWRTEWLPTPVFSPGKAHVDFFVYHPSRSLSTHTSTLQSQMDNEVSREEQSSCSPPRTPNWEPIIWTDILRLDILGFYLEVRIQEFRFKISVSDVNHLLCNVVFLKLVILLFKSGISLSMGSDEIFIVWVTRRNSWGNGCIQCLLWTENT